LFFFVYFVFCLFFLWGFIPFDAIGPRLSLFADKGKKNDEKKPSEKTKNLSPKAKL